MVLRKIADLTQIKFVSAGNASHCPHCGQQAVLEILIDLVRRVVVVDDDEEYRRLRALPFPDLLTIFDLAQGD